MFDHLADPNPPTAGSSIRTQVERRLRRRQHRRVGGAITTGSALVLAAVVAIAVNTGSSGQQISVRDAPLPTAGGRSASAASFLTVRGSPGSVELQDRRISDGKLEAVLLKFRSVHDMVASFEPDGDVLAAVQTSQCGGRLYSINPRAGTVREAGALDSSIAALSGLTVSANGRYAAYIAYPGCQQGTPTPTTIAPAGPPGTTPTDELTYVAVQDLATGATTELPLDDQGDLPGEDPVWSPDGTKIAIIGNDNKLRILSSVYPRLRFDSTVEIPANCYVDAIGAWTRAGITTSLTCRHAGRTKTETRQTSIIEQIQPGGRVTHRAPAPTKLDVNSIESSLPGLPAILDSLTALPEKGGPPFSTKLSEYNNGTIRTILSVRNVFLSLPD